MAPRRVHRRPGGATTTIEALQAAGDVAPLPALGGLAVGAGDLLGELLAEDADGADLPPVFIPPGELVFRP